MRRGGTTRLLEDEPFDALEAFLEMLVRLPLNPPGDIGVGSVHRGTGLGFNPPSSGEIVRRRDHDPLRRDPPCGPGCA